MSQNKKVKQNFYINLFFMKIIENQKYFVPALLTSYLKKYLFISKFIDNRIALLSMGLVLFNICLYSQTLVEGRNGNII